MLNESEQSKLRREKLAELRRSDLAYPNDFRPDAQAGELQQRFQDYSSENLQNEEIVVSIAGRLMSRRKMGKVTFADFRDASGKIQLFVRKNALSEDEYSRFQSFDIGDIVGVHGTVFRTRTGELSIAVDSIRLLTKALQPFPEKFHGLTDQELRYRQRYLDLIINQDVKETFQTRSAIIRCIRAFMDEHEYLEVETPMMHSIPGGAIARPFITHHNALSLDMYLRVAPELFLKRLVVGGLEKVYEINRNFRNEGVSTQHNPEFTMLEFYQTYADYNDFMNFTELMFERLIEEVPISSTINFGEHEIDLRPPYRRLSLHEAVLSHNTELKREDLDQIDRLRSHLEQVGGPISNQWGAGKLLFEVFERTVEDQLIQPTFITHYPLEVSPLSRVSDSEPTITDRFEFFVGGMEIANGFSELNDPEDQAERFMHQIAQRQSGDHEAMHYDDDYIRALEFGLPPSAGEGIGIDRLVMLLTDRPSIRDVILFPYMKPISQTGE